jgi:homoserine kinase
MRVSVKVPATSANLGPGFDCLGLALDLWNEAVFISADDFEVRIQGEGAGTLPQDAQNAILRAAQQLAQAAGKPPALFQLHCINRIPLTSGLGSSSAAMLTGFLGANALLGGPFSRQEVLRLAVETEGHPDNVAPAMLGGLVASTMIAGRVSTHKIPMQTSGGRPMHVTIVLPNFDLPTQQARAILPKQIPMKDAVYNISRAVLVAEALRTGDLDLLGQTMSDALHQPYRLPLIPGAQAAMDAAKQAGAAAVALSGAGPSLIAFSSNAESAIGEAMKRAFEAAGRAARIFVLKIASHGAEIEIQ